MKRYALFFVLICVQVNIALPMWFFSQQKEERDPIDNFKNQIDQAVNKEHRFYVLGLKGVCSKYIEGIAQLYFDKQTMLHDLKGEAEFCVGNYAQEKAKEEYEQRTTRNLFSRILLGKEPYNELIQQKYGNEARQKAIRRFRKGAGKLTYLFNDYSSKDVLKKVEDECGRRVAIRAIFFGLAKNEMAEKERNEQIIKNRKKQL